jgi:hypothetical protein
MASSLRRERLETKWKQLETNLWKSSQVVVSYRKQLFPSHGNKKWKQPETAASKSFSLLGNKLFPFWKQVLETKPHPFRDVWLLFVGPNGNTPTTFSRAEGKAGMKSGQTTPLNLVADQSEIFRAAPTDFRNGTESGRAVEGQGPGASRNGLADQGDSVARLI